MRKRTVRSGLRCILWSLMLIVLFSFYPDSVANLLSLPYHTISFIYRTGIFLSAALGGYGVVRTVLGLLQSGGNRDSGVRLLPTLMLMLAVVWLFFSLVHQMINNSPERYRERYNPEKSITIRFQPNLY